MFQKGCLLEKSAEPRNYNSHSVGKRNHILSFSWKIIKPFMNLYSGSYALLSRHGHNPFRWGGGSSIQFQKKPKNINMFPFESCILLLDNVYGHLWYHRDFFKKTRQCAWEGGGEERRGFKVNSTGAHYDANERKISFDCFTLHTIHLVKCILTHQ